MSKNLEASIRYRVINRLLKSKSKKFPTKEELREACADALGVNDVAPRTIEKDLRVMREDEQLGFLAPIKYDAYHKGYYYEDPHYSIDNIPLNEDDVETLQFASSILEQFRGVDVLKSFSGAVDKVIDSFNIRRQSKEQGKLDFIYFDNPEYIPGGDFLMQLLSAIKYTQVVRLEYQKFETEAPKPYTFHPYLLRENKNLWYVIGKVEEYDQFRIFALDRIKGLEPTESYFNVDQAFDKAKYLKNVVGVFLPEGEVEEVLLRFSKQTSHYVMTQPIHPTQEVVEENEQGTTIRLRVVPNPELKTLVLGYGNKVEVLSPASLRAEVKKELIEAVTIYS